MRSTMALDTYPWSEPLDSIKDYLGEKLAVYNGYVGHQSVWLRYPSLVGIAVQGYCFIMLEFSSRLQPFFAVLMLFWAFPMQTFWQREQNTLMLQWGMYDYFQHEMSRPEFKGVVHSNGVIDGKEEVYFPPNEIRRRLVFSFSLSSWFLLLMIGVLT
jgi:hypothetical protein